MTPQMLITIANLIPLVAAPVQQALSALLNRSGIDSDRLLEMAGQNNQTTLALIESEINRVGAGLPPSAEMKASGDALLADLSVKTKSTAKPK